jgi:hypothetical protein
MAQHIRLPGLHFSHARRIIRLLIFEAQHGKRDLACIFHEIASLFVEIETSDLGGSVVE